MKEIGEEFIERTKHQYIYRTDQIKGKRQPPFELNYDQSTGLIDLPKPDKIKIKNIDLRKAIETRTSIREYSPAPLTIEELSYLLWCTQGVRKVAPFSGTFRTVPSAGARHAFETYLLMNNVQDLRPGLYRFLAINHKLILINTEPGLAEKIVSACFNQDFIKTSAVTFIWTALPYRMTWRYGERGYRYLFLDAGHVCQNLYLSAESIDCGVCAVAAFSDDELNRLLNLIEKDQFVIYLAAVGKK